MEILMMDSPSARTTYLEIFEFSGNLGKTNQNNLKMCLLLDLEQFASFRGGVLVLMKLWTTLQHSVKLTYPYRCFYVL